MASETIILYLINAFFILLIAKPTILFVLVCFIRLQRLFGFRCSEKTSIEKRWDDWLENYINNNPIS